MRNTLKLLSLAACLQSCASAPCLAASIGIFRLPAILTRQNAVGTIGAANVGTFPNLTASSFYEYSIPGPGPVCVTFTVKGGNSALHFFSQAEGLTYQPIPDAGIYRQDTMTYGAPAAGVATTYYFTAPAGNLWVVASAFTSATYFSASFGPATSLYPGQTPGRSLSNVGYLSGSIAGLISSGAHKVSRIHCDNASSSTAYFMVFDSLTQPSNGAIPLFTVTTTFGVSTSPTPGDLGFSPDWMQCYTGLYGVWSTTFGTLTAASSGSGLSAVIYGN